MKKKPFLKTEIACSIAVSFGQNFKKSKVHFAGLVSIHKDCCKPYHYVY